MDLDTSPPCVLKDFSGHAPSSHRYTFTSSFFQHPSRSLSFFLNPLTHSLSPSTVHHYAQEMYWYLSAEAEAKHLTHIAALTRVVVVQHNDTQQFMIQCPAHYMASIGAVHVVGVEPAEPPTSNSSSGDSARALPAELEVTAIPIEGNFSLRTMLRWIGAEALFEPTTGALDQARDFVAQRSRTLSANLSLLVKGVGAQVTASDTRTYSAVVFSEVGPIDDPLLRTFLGHKFMRANRGSVVICGSSELGHRLVVFITPRRRWYNLLRRRVAYAVPVSGLEADVVSTSATDPSGPSKVELTSTALVNVAFKSPQSQTKVVHHARTQS